MKIKTTYHAEIDEQTVIANYSLGSTSSIILSGNEISLNITFSTHSLNQLSDLISQLTEIQIGLRDKEIERLKDLTKNYLTPREAEPKIENGKSNGFYQEMCF